MKQMLKLKRRKIRPLYKHLPDDGTRTWLNHIWLNAHKYKFGWMQACTGGVRCGKSMTLCTMGELLNPRPLDEYNIAFTPKEYIQSLDNIKSGEVVIWSELGTALNARKWQSMSNILVTEVVQTMMIKKPIVLMDLPDLGFVDKNVRKLIYCYSEARRWENNPVKLWIYRISIDRKKGKIYFPHPLVKTEGGICKLRGVNIRMMAPTEIWYHYDKKQKKYKNRLRKKHLTTLEAAEKDLMGEELTIYDYINIVSKDITKYTNTHGKLDWHLIKLDLGISRDKATQIQKFLNKHTSA